MRDVAATLAALAAVVGCAQCGKHLGSSPSADFCGEACQALWLRNRTAHPDQVLGSGSRNRPPSSGPDPTAPAPCPHCSRWVRRFPTVHGRVQVVNAQPDPGRGNIRWMPGERVCVQYGAKNAAQIRAAGPATLFVFHGLDCPETLARSSSNPRSSAQRSAPPADPEARSRVMGDLADQLGWRPGGKWRWRR